MFISIFFCRFAQYLSYYGLLLGIDSLAGDIYINNFIAGLVEVVAYALAFLTLKSGRKKIYVGMCILAGLGLILAPVASLYAPGNC